MFTHMFRQRALCHLVGSTWPSMAGRGKIQKKMIRFVISISIIIVIVIIDYIAEYITILTPLPPVSRDPTL